MVSLKYNNVEINFGTGADGALTVNAANSPYIITTNKNFTNVTVEAGGVLVIARPLTATFTATIFASSTTLTVISGTVTGTISAGNEISGGPVKLGTTIASGSSLSWVLSQTQFSTIPAGGVTTSGLTTYGAMPLVRISGTLTVNPASGATAAGIIRGDYQDDIYLPFVNSGSGIEFVRNSAAYDSYNNSYFKSGTAQQWPGALYGRNGAFNNPDNSTFSRQEEYIASSGNYRNQDRYGGDYGRNPAGGGGGAGYSGGTGGQNAVNDGGSQPGGAGGYQNSNNPRPSSVSLTSYDSNISLLYDGHRGGNAGDSSTSRGRGGKSLRVIARTIQNNGLITANGENGVSVGRGGGGGGGAGTVIVFCEIENGSGTYEARGGIGGTGDGSWPAGFGGQGGGGSIERYVGATYFSGTINTTGTSSVTGTTTGVSSINGLTYVPDNPIVQIDASATGSSTAETGSLSFSHTVGTGSNILLLVSVTTGGNYSSAITSVTFGSQNLKYLDCGYINTSGTSGSSTYNKTKFRTELWYLTSPASGAANVVITAASGLWIVGASVSFTGIHQSTPFTSFSSNQSLNTYITTTGSTAAKARSFSTITTDLLYSIIAFPLSTNATLGTSQIDSPNGFNVNANNGTNYLHVQGSYKYAADASSEMSYTLASNQHWVITNVSLKVISDSSDIIVPTATTLSACSSAVNTNYTGNSKWSKGSVLTLYGDTIKIGASSGATVTTVGNVIFRCSSFDLNGSTIDGNGAGWPGGEAESSGLGESASYTAAASYNQNKYGISTSVGIAAYVVTSTTYQGGVGGLRSITSAWGKGGGGGANRGWGGTAGHRSDNSSNAGYPGGGGQSVLGAWGTTSLPFVQYSASGTLATYTSSNITYNVVTFTGSGNITFSKSTNVDILLIGAGGGGGRTIGGGGGGGEVKSLNLTLTSNGSYDFTAGTAGAGGNPALGSGYVGGTSGGSSTLVGLGVTQTALGGGGGGGYNVNATGSVGASGGGQGASGGAGIAAGSGFYSGGTASSTNNGAGGGGAGGGGSNVTTGSSVGIGAFGGIGVNSTITGTSESYGGGGGGGARNGYGTGGSGRGGGGDGGAGNTSPYYGGQGVRGGGGGGGGYTSSGDISGSGGYGSTGMMIVRWNSALTPTSSIDSSYPEVGLSSVAFLTAGGGGGGGGGTQYFPGVHDQLEGVKGGAGGGVIWVDASALFTGSGTIRCNGVNGTSTTTGTGAGGGGAGGYILITTKNFSSTGTFTANGGNGGSSTASDATGGGGGGGGVVLIYYKFKSTTPTVTATKGLKGSSGSGTIASLDGDDGLTSQIVVSGYWKYDVGGTILWF